MLGSVKVISGYNMKYIVYSILYCILYTAVCNTLECYWDVEMSFTVTQPLSNIQVDIQ